MPLPPPTADSPLVGDSVHQLVQRWLETNDADDHCGCLRLTPMQLMPIVVARCAKRSRRKVPLKAGRECDPCVCGWQGGWHRECYWHFNQDHLPKIPPSTEKHALPWRAKISKTLLLGVERMSEVQCSSPSAPGGDSSSPLNAKGDAPGATETK